MRSESRLGLWRPAHRVQAPHRGALTKADVHAVGASAFNGHSAEVVLRGRDSPRTGPTSLLGSMYLFGEEPGPGPVGLH
jgi:hypothetical protein